MTIDVPDFTQGPAIAGDSTPAGLAVTTNSTTGTVVLPALTPPACYRLWAVSVTCAAGGSFALLQQIGGGIEVLFVLTGQALSMSFPIGVKLPGSIGLELDQFSSSVPIGCTVAYDILPQG